MSESIRLNPVAESILKLLHKRPANLDNIAFVLDIEEVIIGNNVNFLLANNYICECKIPSKKADGISKKAYKTTVEGENYLSTIKFFHIHNKRQFVINVLTGTTSLIALIKAFWNEISEILLPLMQ